MKMQNGREKVIKCSMLILFRKRKEKCVYALNSRVEASETNVRVGEKESPAQVWHKWLGHISETWLHELEKREVLGKKILKKLEFCENCVMGKSTRVSFGRGQHTTTRVIDYVHANMGGEDNRVESMSGYKYFLSIEDDYV